MSPFLFIFGAHLGNVRMRDEQTLLAVSHCDQAIACDATADQVVHTGLRTLLRELFVVARVATAVRPKSYYG